MNFAQRWTSVSDDIRCREKVPAQPQDGEDRSTNVKSDGYWRDARLMRPAEWIRPRPSLHRVLTQRNRSGDEDAG